jgi:hypothetical protein
MVGILDNSGLCSVPLFHSHANWPREDALYPLSQEGIRRGAPRLIDFLLSLRVSFQQDVILLGFRP